MPKKLFRPWKCTRKNTKRKNSVRSLSEEENSSRSSSNGSVRDEKVCSSSSISECEDSTMGSLDRLSRFVFNGTVDLPRPESSNASENSPRSTVTPDTVPISAFRPVYQYPMNFMPFDYSNPLGLGMGLGPSDNQAVVEAAAAMATSVVAGSHAHSGIYGLPALPLGSYGARVAEAICLQDAVAKQRKKQRPKKFTCEFCNAAFSNNGQLKGHIRIHTGKCCILFFNFLCLILMHIFFYFYFLFLF